MLLVWQLHIFTVAYAHGDMPSATRADECAHSSNKLKCHKASKKGDRYPGTIIRGNRGDKPGGDTGGSIAIARCIAGSKLVHVVNAHHNYIYKPSVVSDAIGAPQREHSLAATMAPAPHGARDG